MTAEIFLFKLKFKFMRFPALGLKSWRGLTHWWYHSSVRKLEGTGLSALMVVAPMNNA